MKKFRKSVSIMILLFMMFNMNISAIERNDQVEDEFFSFHMKENSVAKEGADLEILLTNKSCVSGTLYYNNERYDIQASGNVETYSVVSKDDYCYGVFEGVLKKNNKIIDNIVFDIHYDNKTKRYSSSSMTIGTLTKNNEKITTINFGFMKDDLNKGFFNKYILNNHENRTQKLDISEFFPNTDYIINNYSNKNILRNAVSDFSIRAFAYVRDSKNKPAIAIASYHPLSVENHSVCGMHMKTWLYEEGILGLFKDKIGGNFLAKSASTNEVYMKITNEKYWQSESTTPVTGSKELKIPLLLGWSLDSNVITVNVPTYKIDVKKVSFPSTSPTDNQVVFRFWTLSSFDDQLFINTMSPWIMKYGKNNPDESKGFAVRSSFVFQAGVNQNTIQKVKSKVNYRLSATQYNGQYIMKYLNITKEIESTILVK